jgi:hypothetical protein
MEKEQTKMTDKAKQLIEKFQCPGCVCGMDTDCGALKLNEEYGVSCRGHVIGTHIGLGNPVALGFPKGFNKPGFNLFEEGPCKHRNQMLVRLWEKDATPEDLWDDFNVPVWAMVVDGFLFVRTFSPRINMTYVDVIEEGTLEMVPQAINIKFAAEQIMEQVRGHDPVLPDNVGNDSEARRSLRFMYNQGCHQGVIVLWNAMRDDQHYTISEKEVRE